MTAARRVILHVDMDAFFVSVELRRRPELRGRPVVVGGNGRRGVVAAASYEARRFGVYSAMPSAVAKQRCPEAVFLAGDHDLYSQVSAAVRAIFDRFTPLVEPLSLDEAFLDISGTTRLFGDGPTVGQQIRATVRDELDLTCSVGVAPNKFLAKLASVEAKPRATASGVVPGHGVFEVRPGQELEYLAPLPVSRLWGVGPKTLDKLRRLGVDLVGDLNGLDRVVLERVLGVGTTKHLLALAVGDDRRRVEPSRQAKSIGHEETYEYNKHTVAELHRELVRLADAVAQRLRRAATAARTLTLKVRFDAGFRTISRATTLDRPVDDGPSIVAALQPLLEQVDPTPGVRLLGVAASNFSQPQHQLSFDDLLDDQAVSATQRAASTNALDSIRDRFGDGAIGPASAIDRRRLKLVRGGQQQWGPNTSENSSDRVE